MIVYSLKYKNERLFKIKYREMIIFLQSLLIFVANDVMIADDDRGAEATIARRAGRHGPLQAAIPPNLKSRRVFGMGPGENISGTVCKIAGELSCYRNIYAAF